MAAQRTRDTADWLLRQTRVGAVQWQLAPRIGYRTTIGLATVTLTGARLEITDMHGDRSVLGGDFRELTAAAQTCVDRYIDEVLEGLMHDTPRLPARPRRRRWWRRRG